MLTMTVHSLQCMAFAERCALDILFETSRYLIKDACFSECGVSSISDSLVPVASLATHFLFRHEQHSPFSVSVRRGEIIIYYFVIFYILLSSLTAITRFPAFLALFW